MSLVNWWKYSRAQRHWYIRKSATQLQMSHNFHTNVVSRCVKGRMGNSTSTCYVPWMWPSSLGEPSLTWRAQRRRWGYWRVESTMTILSSWLWVFISRIYLLGFHRFVTYYPYLLYLWTAWTLLYMLVSYINTVIKYWYDFPVTLFFSPVT